VRWFLALLGLAFLASLLTGVTQVQPGERAVVRRFGRILDDKPSPGLYIGLPWGIDRVDRVPVGRVRRVTVGQLEGEEQAEAMPAGQLLTGDHNLVNLGAEVYYRVIEEQVEKFVIHADRTDSLVARATEAALAEWVAGRDVDTVLLRGKAALPAWLVVQVQKRMDQYDIGVKIEEASVSRLAPPDDVKGAFDDVSRAQTEIRTQVYNAEQTANRRVSEAQSEKFRLERLTAAYAQEQHLLAQAEADNFDKRLAQYRELRIKNPYYLAGVWWDEMGRLFARMKENGRIDLLDHHLTGDGLNITQMPLLPKKK
jgi:membrane protease subunit HflK